MAVNVKKILLIVILSVVLGTGLLITVVYIFLDYSYDSKIALPNKAESFYYDNKDMLNEFVALCFENNIKYMASAEKDGNSTYRYKIDGYYIYVNYELPPATRKRLSDMISIFKNNNISNIYIDEENNDYVSFVMSSFLAGTSIEYLSEKKPIEEVKKENYSDNAWYVDDNWLIIDGRFL